MTAGRAGADPASGLSPPQMALRFALELAGLAAWGLAAWELTGDGGRGVLRWIAGVAAAAAVAVAWATFRVPGDSGGANEAPVRVPGTVRLVLELVALLGGAVAVTYAGETVFGVVLAVAVVGHYVTTLPRVAWLLRQ